MNIVNSAKITDSESIQADVVIIGAGAAGLAAAVAAAEAGVKEIVVLEVRSAPGGNLVFVGGLLGAETPLQKRLGVDARKDDIFRKAMEYAHWKLNPRLVRVLVDKSGDTIRWLEEKGVKFERLVPHQFNQVPLTFHAIGGAGQTGAAIVKALVKSCQELGVRFFYQTAAKKILTDEDGNVSGVLAETKEGELKIAAKGVIIATGGFAGNKELLKKYEHSFSEDEVFLIGLPHKGDGIQMAVEIGAATDGLVTLERRAPFVPRSRRLTVVAARPTTIWVNSKGERFTDENLSSPMEAANIIHRQPRRTSYSILDEGIMRSIIQDELNPFEELFLEERSLQEGMDEELKLHAAEGRIKISNSWDEIANWIGVPPEVLKHTIDEYNSFYDRGYDELFVKDRRYLVPLRYPPYYAIRCGVAILTTHGGVKINHRTEVLDSEDRPIPGLYAAGVETGGTESDTYNIFLSGHSSGFAIGSGRIAGEEAAKRATMDEDK